jgi:hypothetical protein
VGNTHPLDAAADVMDSPALLLVDLAKLMKKRRRSMELKTELTLNVKLIRYLF